MHKGEESSRPMANPHGVTVVLGAGASRGVSYASKRPVFSPLDSDFIALLQQLTPSERDQEAVDWVLKQAFSDQTRLWESMERFFYTLHMRAKIGETLFHSGEISAAEVEARFARAIQSLLRAAHQKEVCKHHQRLFRPLTARDSILTFNYDLVPERALRRLHEKTVEFDRWVYELDPRPRSACHFPSLLKLHGSSNWRVRPDGFFPTQDTWLDFDKAPGYGRFKVEEAFPILLPYWDKRIEEDPWVHIWETAAGRLRHSDKLIVWGYSLPLTDVKARELFRTGLEIGSIEWLCVIDPSDQSRLRWRDIALRKKFRPYASIDEFFAQPPAWWRDIESTAAKSSAI